MSSKQNQRVVEYRQRMKDQGLSNVTVWIDKETKDVLRRLEKDERQSKGELIAEALKLLEAKRESKSEVSEESVLDSIKAEFKTMKD